MDEDGFSLDGWLNEELYAFVERNDRVDESRSIVVFDAVRVREVDKLLDGQASTEELAALSGIMAVAELVDEQDEPEQAETPEATWQSVRLGDGTPAEVYPELDAAPVRTKLTCRALPTHKAQALTKAFSISHMFPKATVADLQHLLPPI